MKTVKSILVPILLSVVLFSCTKDCIVQSGTIITDNIDISGFTGISVEGNYDVVIDTGFYEVSINADRAFVPYVKFEKTGDILRIYTANNRCLDGKRPYIHIYAPNMETITEMGSGSLECNDLYNDKISINHEGSGEVSLYNVDTYDAEAVLSGSGSIYLDGIGKTAKYELSGSGIIKGLYFSVDYGDVSVPGSGEVYIDAYKTLNIEIGGSGRVFYKDYNGLIPNIYIPGSGEVIPLNN